MNRFKSLFKYQLDMIYKYIVNPNQMKNPEI